MTVEQENYRNAFRKYTPTMRFRYVKKKSPYGGFSDPELQQLFLLRNVPFTWPEDELWLPVPVVIDPPEAHPGFIP